MGLGYDMTKAIASGSFHRMESFREKHPVLSGVATGFVAVGLGITSLAAWSGISDAKIIQTSADVALGGEGETVIDSVDIDFGELCLGSTHSVQAGHQARIRLTRRLFGAIPLGVTEITGTHYGQVDTSVCTEPGNIEVLTERSPDSVRGSVNLASSDLYLRTTEDVLTGREIPNGNLVSDSQAAGADLARALGIEDWAGVETFVNNVDSAQAVVDNLALLHAQQAAGVCTRDLLANPERNIGAAWGEKVARTVAAFVNEKSEGEDALTSDNMVVNLDGQQIYPNPTHEAVDRFRRIKIPEIKEIDDFIKNLTERFDGNVTFTNIEDTPDKDTCDVSQEVTSQFSGNAAGVNP